MSRRYYPELTEMVKACLAHCVVDIFAPAQASEEGTRTRLGIESMQGHSHLNPLEGYVFLDLIFPSETTGRQQAQAANEGTARSL